MIEPIVNDRGAAIMVMSDLGVGKTTQVAAAAQGCLYVATDDTTLRAYASGIKAMQNPEQAKLLPESVRTLLQGKTMPKDVKIIRREHRRSSDGAPMPNDYAIKTIIQWFTDGGGYKEFPGGIVFDEWNEFLSRIQAEYELMAKAGDQRFVSSRGKTNFWSIITELDRLSQYVLSIPKRVPTKLYLVTHMRSPSYFDEGPSAGQIKYKGGPMSPAGNISKAMGANATVLVELAAVNPEAPKTIDANGMERIEKVDPKTTKAKRVWITSANAEWDRKWRDFRIEGLAPNGIIDADEWPLERLLKATDFL